MKKAKMNAVPPPGIGNGKKPPFKKGAGAKAVPAKAKGPKPQWAGIADQMLGKC